MSEFSKATAKISKYLNYISLINEECDYTLGNEYITTLLLSVINTDCEIAFVDITFKNINGETYSSKNVTIENRRDDRIKYVGAHNVGTYITKNAMLFSVDGGLITNLIGKGKCDDVKICTKRGNDDIITLTIKPKEVIIQVLINSKFSKYMSNIIGDENKTAYIQDSFKSASTVIEIELNYSKICTIVNDFKLLDNVLNLNHNSKYDDILYIYNLIQHLLNSRH